MSDYRLSYDSSVLLHRLEGIQKSCKDPRVLHERITIRLQRKTFKDWPKGPKLSPFTMLSRRGQTPLSDSGHLKLSLVGSTPSSIGRAPDSLNMAGPNVSIFGTTDIKARLQNYGPKGGVLKPVRAKYLALPMTLQARKYKSPRDFKEPELALWPLKSGNGFYLVEGEKVKITRGKNKGKTVLRPKKTDVKAKKYPKAHYLLTKEVKIPPRPFWPTEQEIVKEVVLVGKHWLGAVYSTGAPPNPGDNPP